MPSDTFAEVVRKLRSHAEAWKISGTEDREHLIGEEKMAFDCLVAARLLEAAGRECRAWRMDQECTAHGTAVYHALTALDALAPEMKEVGR